MQDDETFSEFYAKLCDILNSLCALGTKVDDITIKWKILRSLPKRFHAKITSLETSINIESELDSIEDLVGLILTFEMNLPSLKKASNIALSSTR